MTDVRAAGELLLPLARRCGDDLERFLGEIAVGAETDALDPRAEAITLLTLHGAKGLEFDVVFLAGCERRLLPLRLPGSGPLTPEDAAEERRLLFVGMTRARERLLLSYAARRTRHGSEETTGRSSFLAALAPVPPGLTAPRGRARGPPVAAALAGTASCPGRARRRPAARRSAWTRPPWTARRRHVRPASRASVCRYERCGRSSARRR